MYSLKITESNEDHLEDQPKQKLSSRFRSSQMHEVSSNREHLLDEQGVSHRENNTASRGLKLESPMETGGCDACNSGKLGIFMAECPECGGSNKRNCLGRTLKDILPLNTPQDDCICVQLFMDSNPALLDFLDSVADPYQEDVTADLAELVSKLYSTVASESVVDHDILMDHLLFFEMVGELTRDSLLQLGTSHRLSSLYKQQLQQYAETKDLLSLVCWINEHEQDLTDLPEPGSAVGMA